MAWAFGVITLGILLVVHLAAWSSSGMVSLPWEVTKRDGVTAPEVVSQHDLRRNAVNLSGVLQKFRALHFNGHLRRMQQGIVNQAMMHGLLHAGLVLLRQADWHIDLYAEIVQASGVLQFIGVNAYYRALSC